VNPLYPKGKECDGAKAPSLSLWSCGPERVKKMKIFIKKKFKINDEF
jgi:hypothetical protein